MLVKKHMSWVYNGPPVQFFSSPLMSCYVFLPDGDETNSGLAGEMQAELYPELLFYVHKEGTLDTVVFTGQEKKRRVREVWGL